MYRIGAWYVFNDNLKSFPGLPHQRKTVFSKQRGPEVVDVKAERVDPQCRPSLTLCASCHLQQSPETNREHTQHPSPPRASHRNFAVSFFSNHRSST